jgi:hypothetical protein
MRAYAPPGGIVNKIVVLFLKSGRNTDRCDSISSDAGWLRGSPFLIRDIPVQGARWRQPVCNPGLQYETGGFDMRNKKADANKKNKITDSRMKEGCHV